MTTMSEAIERGRHAWQTKHGKCTMCAAGDEPVLGYHRQFRPCGNETRFFYRHCLARIFRVDVKDIDRWMETGSSGRWSTALAGAAVPSGTSGTSSMLYGRDGEARRTSSAEDIFETYEKHPHAFERGCGRDTMAYWICEATGVRHSAPGDPPGPRRDGKRRALREGSQLQRTHDLSHGRGTRTPPVPPAPGPTQPGWRLESQGPDELILRRLGPTSKADWYEDPRL